MSDPAIAREVAAVAGQDHTIRVERGIVFGQAAVGCSAVGGPHLRELKLDVYEPEKTGSAPRCALILAFGGAFHRGSRGDDVVAEGVSVNTSIARYCELFARRGYVAFSIDYRLVQEDPDPGDTPVVRDPDAVPRSRVDVVRRMLGLPPATNRMLWCGIEAASDDFAMAFRFVASNATRWHVDPARIAVGGFSAGARSAWNAAYGEGVDAAAVVALSGAMGADDLTHWLTTRRDLPPLLLVRGDTDLDYVRASNPVALDLCRSANIDCAEAIVADAGHFYPSSARADGNEFSGSVEAVMAAFLERVLGADR